MRILLTNDDGIQSPGLEVLEKIARRLTRSRLPSLCGFENLEPDITE
jgi:Survival protein SurE